MESPAPSVLSPGPSQLDGPKRFQLDALKGLHGVGFDHKAMMAIANLVQDQGREGLDYYLSMFLAAIKNVSLEELSVWVIQATDNTPVQKQPPVSATEVHVQHSALDMMRSILVSPAEHQPSIASHKRSRLELIRDASANTDNVHYESPWCIKLGCKKTYVREGHFIRHFVNNHLGAYDGKCCKTAFTEGQAFAKHIWQHKIEKPFTATPDITHTNAARTRASLPEPLVPESSRSLSTVRRPTSEPVLPVSQSTTLVHKQPQSLPNNHMAVPSVPAQHSTTMGVGNGYMSMAMGNPSLTSNQSSQSAAPAHQREWRDMSTFAHVSSIAPPRFDQDDLPEVDQADFTAWDNTSWIDCDSNME